MGFSIAKTIQLWGSPYGTFPPWHGKPQVSSSRRPPGVPAIDWATAPRRRTCSPWTFGNAWDMVRIWEVCKAYANGDTWYDMISFFGGLRMIQYFLHDDNRAKKRSRPRVGTWIHRSKTFNQLVAFKDVNTSTVGIFFWGKGSIYPQKAIEHGHWNSGFTHQKWWFSIVVCMFTSG